MLIGKGDDTTTCVKVDWQTNHDLNLILCETPEIINILYLYPYGCHFFFRDLDFIFDVLVCYQRILDDLIHWDTIRKAS
jgi:hypothetical protein